MLLHKKLAGLHKLRLCFVPLSLAFFFRLSFLVARGPGIFVEGGITHDCIVLYLMGLCCLISCDFLCGV